MKIGFVINDIRTEIAAYTGGIGVVERLYDVNFADHIIADLESKTMSHSYYGHRLNNVELATL
jgi:hypothetical protein